MPAHARRRSQARRSMLHANHAQVKACTCRQPAPLIRCRRPASGPLGRRLTPAQTDGRASSPTRNQGREPQTRQTSDRIQSRHPTATAGCKDPSQEDSKSGAPQHLSLGRLLEARDLSNQIQAVYSYQRSKLQPSSIQPIPRSRRPHVNHTLRPRPGAPSKDQLLAKLII
jgi:hypothetical protein